MDGASQAEQGDYSRSLKHANFLVTETNAQTTDWYFRLSVSALRWPASSRRLHASFQRRQHGRVLALALHPSGQETYWKGVLSHDLEPNRAYAEVSRTAHELQKIGPTSSISRFTTTSRSSTASTPPTPSTSCPLLWLRLAWHTGNAVADYKSVVHQLHRALYNANVGTDFVFPEDADFSQYKLIVIPPLYIADDALLKKISDYVKGGGHVLMTLQERLRERELRGALGARSRAAPRSRGLSYQEFSNLEKPLGLKGDPFKAVERIRSCTGQSSCSWNTPKHRILRSSLLRAVACHHAQRIRQWNSHLRRNVPVRRFTAGCRSRRPARRPGSRAIPAARSPY